MMHILKQILIIVTCLVQITGTQITINSLELCRVEKVPNDINTSKGKFEQDICNKAFVDTFVKESFNNRKLTTP